MGLGHEQQEVGASAPAFAVGGRSSLGRRCGAALVVLAGGGLLGLATRLAPDPRGYGTHQQLGGGPCGLLVVTGYPCPTCGMTTAFAYAVRGRWVKAFLAQPAGFALALLTGVGAGVALWVLLTGRWPPIRLPLITPYRFFIGLLVLLVGGWAFKMMLGLLDGSLPVRGVRL